MIFAMCAVSYPKGKESVLQSAHGVAANDVYGAKVDLLDAVLLSSKTLGVRGVGAG